MSIIPEVKLDRKLLTSPSAGLSAGIAGLLLALISALGLKTGLLMSQDWVAQVNGTDIPASEYNRALLAMQDGLKRGLTEADRRKALQVLVDEELLLQEAETLGLTRSDMVVRKNLIQAMMKTSTSFSETEPDEAQLQEFYAAHPALFAAPLIFTVVGVETAFEAEAAKFVRALQQGETFSSAAQRLTMSGLDIPENIPHSKLMDYIGGDMAQKLTQLNADDISGPFEQAGRFRFFWIKRKTGGPQSFEAVRNSVKAEWQRRENEQAFQSYLDGLRRSARVTIKADTIK